MMRLPKKLSDFRRGETGALTEFGLFLTLTILGVGGLSVDYANSMMTKTRLQIAADAAAHAALLTYDVTRNEAKAREQAIKVATSYLPANKHGLTIKDSDIAFGAWDRTTRSFVAGADHTAVLVNTQRLQERANGVATYFMRFAGLDNIDIRTVSIFETYYPTCFREGFVAQERVDVQSNNQYGAGFCIHSNDHVEINNGNSFDAGVIVSMPDKNDLVIPTNGNDSNPGIDEALRSGSYIFRVLDKIKTAEDFIDDPTDENFITDYVDIDAITGLPPARVALTHKDKLDASTWKPGHVHQVTCNAPSQKLTVPANEVLVKGVVITNCKISFGANSRIEDAIFITTNTDDNSVTGASGVTFGRDDGCLPGGGAQVLTSGGMNFPSNLQVYGGQLVAEKDIVFAARPNGIEGVSMVAGGEIDGSSLINVGFCGGAGMDNNFKAAHFRLAT